MSNISYYRLTKTLLEDYNRYLALVKGDDYDVDFCDNLRAAFVALNRNLTNWRQYAKIHEWDSIQSKYTPIYEESQDFMSLQYPKIFDYEDEINIALPSFKERRRDFQIAQERQRQEKIRQENYMREQERLRREREQKRRLAEQKKANGSAKIIKETTGNRI